MFCFGSHTVAILKLTEIYEDLAAGLAGICDEAKDIEMLKVNEKVFKVEFYLGGDLKFVAVVCGI